MLCIDDDVTAADSRVRQLVSQVTAQGPIVDWTQVGEEQRVLHVMSLLVHTYRGRRLGAAILFDLDAQVDYVVHELRTMRRFDSVHRVLTTTGVSLNAASDEVVYRYEVPGSILDRSRPRPYPPLPRTAAAVQAIFRARRANASRALRIYQDAGGRTP